jgi:hypothetical protein
VTTNSAASQQLLMENNAAFMEQAKQGELEYRELHDKEIAHIKANSQAFADSLGIDVKAAEARLLVTAYSQTDKAYSEQHAKSDVPAQAYLGKISKVMNMDGEAILTFAPMGYYEDSNKFSDQNGYTAERELLAKQPIFTQTEKNQKIRQQVTEEIFDGSIGIGYYNGIGGEIEVAFNDGKFDELKVGLGIGYGGHFGGKNAAGGLMQGAVGGYNTPQWELNPIQNGTVRIGPSASAGFGLGTVNFELSGSGGAQVNDSGVSGYGNLSAGASFAPAVPKIGAEAKINLIEFSVREPSKK